MNAIGRRVVLAIALCGLAAAGLAHAAGKRAQASDGAVKLTPQIEAQPLRFASGVTPADRAWVLAAIAAARPEARQLIDAVDGLVTVGTVNVPDAPFVGYANPNNDDIGLNVFYLDGQRTVDREQTVLHELGHIVDFILVPDDTIAKLAAEIPSSGTCATPESGDCTAPEERFADTFAKWALRGAVSRAGAGYGITTPGALEEWGQPLDELAAQLSVRP
jgi:hypothetical protein